MRNLSFKKVLLPIGFIFLCIIIFRRCSFHSLPKERIRAVKLDKEETYSEGEYRLSIRSSVNCPMRFYLSCEDEDVNELLGAGAPILLEAREDTIISIKDKGDLTGRIDVKVRWGDPDLVVQSTKLERLPYPTGKSYKLLQGNNSYPTHNSTTSRYAFDFTMKIGDTITAAQEGYVVTAIEGYKGWGRGNAWKSFGNQILIYDTVSHLFMMYGHLDYQGSLVEVGDYVEAGQAIAISGKTGQTSEEHLHFNVLSAYDGKGGIKSHPLDSIGNYKVKELKRYQWMENL